jgi:hypothetical protein
MPAAALGPYRTLIEQWNGTSWSIVSSPNPAPPRNYLNNVTCSSRRNVGPLACITLAAAIRL